MRVRERGHRRSWTSASIIYNAAYSPIGAFIDVDVEDHLKAVDVNVNGLGTLRLSHYFGRRFVERREGRASSSCPR